MRYLTLGLGTAVCALFAWVVVMRFRYPIDAEWMTGSVRDTVERIRDGQPIYTKPSASFVAFLYPPLYYWSAAFLARFTSVFVACKLVSVAASIAIGWGVTKLARDLGASRFWSTVGAMLFGGSYSLTLYFYDLERVDAFAAAWVVVALVVLLGGTRRAADGTTSAVRSLPREIGAGALLGLAFFAKQGGAFAFVAVLVALLLARETKRLVVVALSGAVAFVTLFAYLETTTGGWFRYYCVKLPGSHGVDPALLSTFFVEDLPKAFALAGATVACAAPFVASAVRTRRIPERSSYADAVFVSVLLAGAAASFMLRAHRGGWANVIVAWIPFACIAFAVAASRAEERAIGTAASKTVSLLLLGAASLQLLRGVFDPNDVSPEAADLEHVKTLERAVRDLEAKGEVIVTTTGNLTKPRHFHSAALFDVLRANDPAPEDYVEGLRTRRYYAILVGVPDEYVCKAPVCEELSNVILRNYFVAARLPDHKRTGMVGYEEKPRFVLRPRKAPLPSSMSHDDLLTRSRTEAGIADGRRWPLTADGPILIPDDIEELAATQVPQTP